MYADAIVAAVLQADLVDTPIKNLITSVKVDRMHFKVSFFCQIILSSIRFFLGMFD